MHASIFEYNLSRPYPLKWFTPLTTLGGLVAVVLLSLLNFISSGYTLVAQYSHDPNATVSQTILSRWPSSLTAKLQTSCNSVTIPVNTKLLSNSSALTYTLSEVSLNTKSDNQSSSPSLIYHNNLLSDCTINYISILVDALNRNAAQIAMVHYGTVIQAYLSCTLDTSDQRDSVFNLTAEYNYVSDSVSVYSGYYAFVGRDKIKAASLYWGESLLSMYSLKLPLDFDKANMTWTKTSSRVTQGVITFTPNGTTADLTNAAYFNVLYRFVVPFADNTHGIIYGDSRPNVSTSDRSFDFWNSADILARSLYSTVLTDLGQTQPKANILTNTTLLEYYTANFTNTNSQVAGPPYPGPAQEPYIASNSNTNTGPLGINPSVIAANYLCQVPQQKPIGTLILAIMIADLVFLQALWTLLKLVTDIYVKRKNKQANFCEGCSSKLRQQQNHHHIPRKPLPVGFVPHIPSSNDEDYSLVAVDSRQGLLDRVSPPGQP